MQGVIADGGALAWVERADPVPGPGEVRIRVAYAGVNRADLAQREGRYPPPPGVTDVLGLEASGVVDAVGPGVEEPRVGDRVAALLSGGGCATCVVCPASATLPVPADLPLREAAALPEALCTTFLALEEARAAPGAAGIWHAGASGVGTVALQVARELGLRSFVTVGTPEKLARCRALGAEDGWVRGPEGFVAAARAWAPAGADFAIDPVGGPYLGWDQEAVGPGGRIVILSFLAGRHASLDLGRLLAKRQTVVGTVLRSRSDAEKARIVAAVRSTYWPWVAAGRVGAVLDGVGPFAELDAAHRALASGGTVGKRVVAIGAED